MGWGKKGIVYTLPGAIIPKFGKQSAFQRDNPMLVCLLAQDL